MVEYIIIQAGGKGTRLKKLTQNKPKGIVPVNNLPRFAPIEARTA